MQQTRIPRNQTIVDCTLHFRQLVSYAVSAYLVSPAALQSFWGGGNVATLAEDLADELADLGFLMEDLDVPPSVTANAILRDIADGVIRHGDTAAFAYGYVYEHLCAMFGDRVEPDEEGDGFGYALQYLDAIEPTYSAFLPIPFSDDFPHIASYAPHELAEARVRLTGAAPHAAPEANALLARQLDALFDQAEADGTGVALFNY